MTQLVISVSTIMLVLIRQIFTVNFYVDFGNLINVFAITSFGRQFKRFVQGGHVNRFHARHFLGRLLVNRLLKHRHIPLTPSQSSIRQI